MSCATSPYANTRYAQVLPFYSTHTLTTITMQYGVDLDVPAATILSTFGLRAQSFWWPNVALLGIFFGGFTVLSYIVLHVYVRERR